MDRPHPIEPFVSSCLGAKTASAELADSARGADSSGTEPPGAPLHHLSFDRLRMSGDGPPPPTGEDQGAETAGDGAHSPLPTAGGVGGGAGAGDGADASPPPPTPSSEEEGAIAPVRLSFLSRPQTPGGARPRSLASSHKLGRPVGLASASPRRLAL